MTNAERIVDFLLEAAITIRPSEQGFDWNGLLTVAGVDDAEDPFACLGAFDGDKLIGSVIYQNTGDMLWLEHVYVLDQYRRRGVAEALVREAMRLNPGVPLEGRYMSHEMTALVKKLGGIVDEAFLGSPEPSGVFKSELGGQSVLSAKCPACGRKHGNFRTFEQASGNKMCRYCIRSYVDKITKVRETGNYKTLLNKKNHAKARR